MPSSVVVSVSSSVEVSGVGVSGTEGVVQFPSSAMVGGSGGAVLGGA